MIALNATHAPSLRSWVTSANAGDCDFPIQNLPWGVFRRRGSNEAARCGVAIGDQVVDVSRIADLFADDAAGAARSCAGPRLNELMAQGTGAISALRAQLSRLLSQAAETPARVAEALIPMSEVELLLPMQVGGYTDFFASIHHATNAGRLFRPDHPLLPNYKHVPIAYNGRANSLRVSGVPVVRPNGQLKPPSEGALPTFAPSARLDYEVELGLVIGTSTHVGEPAKVAHAWQHIFGFFLLNDWSARDIQAWEYQPLGPFLAKSFATSVSPWLVTAEALAPFRVASPLRAYDDPEPLAYLSDKKDRAEGALAITIDAHLSTEKMRREGLPSLQLSRSDASTLYWTFAQMIAHHTSNGSALDAGDVLGSGTISGADEHAFGSLLEITKGGAVPFRLPSGEERRFLEDGDEIRLSGFCERQGYVRIGFGECRATVRPAVSRAR